MNEPRMFRLMIDTGAQIGWTVIIGDVAFAYASEQVARDRLANAGGDREPDAPIIVEAKR